MLAREFSGLNGRITAATGLARLSQDADIVICAASLAVSEMLLDELPLNSIICDAGCPKNLSADFAQHGRLVFYGGLGQVSCGIKLDPDILWIMYPYGPAISRTCVCWRVSFSLWSNATNHTHRDAA